MKLTRRSFLVRTSAGAAAIGALAIAPGILGTQVASAIEAPGDTRISAATGSTLNRSEEPVVAHVRDAARGEIAIYAGTREVIIRDPALVSTLLRAL